MESSRAKIAGPVIAAGAVSLGLVLIGACGLGKHDTYVAPPPIKSVGDAAPVVRDGTTATAPRVVIPPSPSWQVAPAGPPRKPVGFTDPSTTLESESTRAPRTMTSPATSTPDFELPTTRARPTTGDPTTEEPTTTRRQATTPEGPYSDDG